MKKNLTEVSKAEEAEVIRANSATHVLRCWHAALMAAYRLLKHRAQLDFKQNLVTENVRRLRGHYVNERQQQQWQSRGLP